MKKNCKYCGKIFDNQEQRTSKGTMVRMGKKYCSDECVKKRTREYRQSEGFKKYQEQWKKDNKDKIKMWRENHYLNNKEALREKANRWREDNREEWLLRCREAQKKYRLKLKNILRTAKGLLPVEKLEEPTVKGTRKIPSNAPSWSVEYKRMCSKVRRARRKEAGILSIKTLQSVYENNIKKFGTLTCYLCLKKIEFGCDSLEHKMPISRGGTNDITNLDIACLICNKQKKEKSYEEYCEMRKL